MLYRGVSKGMMWGWLTRQTKTAFLRRPLCLTPSQLFVAWPLESLWSLFVLLGRSQGWIVSACFCGSWCLPVAYDLSCACLRVRRGRMQDEKGWEGQRGRERERERESTCSWDTRTLGKARSKQGTVHATSFFCYFGPSISLGLPKCTVTAPSRTSVSRRREEGISMEATIRKEDGPDGWIGIYCNIWYHYVILFQP